MMPLDSGSYQSAYSVCTNSSSSPVYLFLCGLVSIRHFDDNRKSITFDGMAAKRRKCVFNDDLKYKYAFIKACNKNDPSATESDVFCEKCRSSFSIANSGKSDIENHIKTVKHKRVVSAAIASSSMTSYFKKKEFETA